MIYDEIENMVDGASQSVDSNPEQEHVTDVSKAFTHDGCQLHIDWHGDENVVSDGDVEEPSDLLQNAKEEAADIKELRQKKNNDIIVKGLGGMSNRNAAFRNMLHTMFYLANLGGFRIEGHIRFVDVYTGKVYD